MTSRKLIARIMFISILGIVAFTLVTGHTEYDPADQDGIAVLVRDGPDLITFDEAISETLILVEANTFPTWLASQSDVVPVAGTGREIETFNMEHLNSGFDRGHLLYMNTTLIKMNSGTYTLDKARIYCTPGNVMLTEYGTIGGILEHSAHPIPAGLIRV